MAKAWDGDEGAYWATHADHFDRAVAGYHGRFLDAAQIRTGDRVLDIGCGTGQTTRDAARVAAPGEALGIDLSGQMIALARQRAAADGLRNARFHQGDAQIHPFGPAAYDVAISRTGAMFFSSPESAFTNIAKALRANGRLALLTWRTIADNEWISEISGAMAAGRQFPAPPPDAPGPFSLSDPDRIRTVLRHAGFTAISVEPVSEPMWFGDDADDAASFIVGLAGWMLDGLDDERRAQALEALRRSIEAHQTHDGVLYDSGVWLTLARRI
jgi:SAM-dependent methyltransferase